MDQIAEIARTVRDVKEQTNALLRRSDGREKRGMTGPERFARHATFLALRSPGVDLHSEFARLFPSLARAVTGPATTTTPGWASELVSGDLLALLAEADPLSVFSRLRQMGISYALAGTGSAKLPIPVPAAEPQADWIGEAMPIKVVQTPFSSVSLVPRKMSVISTMTGELRRRGVENVVRIFQAVLTTDIKRAVDKTLLSDQAGTAVSPPGLRYAVAPLPGSNDMKADLKALVGDLVAKGAAAPVLIVAAVNAISLATMPRDIGIPIMFSIDLDPGIVLGVDSAAFVATAANPEVDVSGDATLHMESETPQPIVSGTFAQPVRSLWQTDSTGVRSTFECGWAAARVSWIDGADW